MENSLLLLSNENTNLSLLVNGRPELLIENSRMEMTLIALSDPEDLEAFGVEALAFLSWPTDGAMFSIPLLSGMKLIRKDGGFLVMMEMSRIYFLEFPNSPPEIQIIIERHIEQFTPLLDPPCGLPLKQQLDYIYGASLEEEEGVLDDEASQSSSGYVKVLDGFGNVLVKGSEYAQAGILKLADYTAKGIAYGTEKYIEKAEKKGEYQVDEKVQKSLEMVSSAAGAAASVSKKMVEVTTDLLVQGGHHVVRKLKERQEQSNSKPSAELKATGRFLVKSLQSLENVSVGLLGGAEILIENVSTSTVEIAHHKYGEQVGKATSSGMKAITSTMGAAKHLSHFAHPSKFALVVGKKSSTRLLSEVSSEDSSSSITANPSLTALPVLPAGHPSSSSSAPLPSYNDAVVQSQSEAQETLQDPHPQEAPPPYQPFDHPPNQ